MSRVRGNSGRVSRGGNAALKISPSVAPSDPLSMGPQKALETIGANLQKQYENWQPRVSLLSAVLWVSCRGLQLLAVRQSLNPGEEHFRSPRPGTPRWTTPYTPLVPRPLPFQPPSVKPTCGVSPAAGGVSFISPPSPHSPRQSLEKKE